MEYKKRYRHVKLRILCDVYNRNENVKSFYRIKCHLEKENSMGRGYAFFLSCLQRVRKVNKKNGLTVHDIGKENTQVSLFPFPHDGTFVHIEPSGVVLEENC